MNKSPYHEIVFMTHYEDRIVFFKFEKQCIKCSVLTKTQAFKGMIGDKKTLTQVSSYRSIFSDKTYATIPAKVRLTKKWIN